MIILFVNILKSHFYVLHKSEYNICIFIPHPFRLDKRTFSGYDINGDFMNIYDMTYKKFCDFFLEKGEKISRAEAVMTALYRDGAESISDFPLSDKIKEILTESFEFPSLECIDISDGETAVKYLFRLSDGNLVETVLMRHEYGGSVCVSTQSGCNMGCKFCRSGRLKKIRNLTPGEIVQQVLFIKQKTPNLTGISIMGIGEPLDTFRNVMDFVDIMLYPKGLAFAPRKITVSTCGLVPEINRLTENRFPCNLAVSLHAPNDTLRSELMPINKAYPLPVLIKSVKDFSEKLNKRVALEYVMIKGVNDSVENAAELAALIGDSKLYVNIIRYNSSEGDIYECSDFSQIMAFYDILKMNNINVTMRRELGSSVNAACGQLRSDYLENGN